MRLPKQTMTVALDDLKELAAKYVQSRSLNHIKNYNPGSTTELQTAHLAGQIQGVVEFLDWSRKEADRLYALRGAETD